VKRSIKTEGIVLTGEWREKKKGERTNSSGGEVILNSEHIRQPSVGRGEKGKRNLRTERKEKRGRFGWGQRKNWGGVRQNIGNTKSNQRRRPRGLRIVLQGGWGSRGLENGCAVGQKKKVGTKKGSGKKKFPRLQLLPKETALASQKPAGAKKSFAIEQKQDAEGTRGVVSTRRDGK